jgi:signal recognition particle subunit SRP54
MFESLQDRFQGIFRNLRAEGRITEEHLGRAMREIRVALLEADVNFQVVRSFVERVKKRALDGEILRSLTPDQQILKVVRDEMVDLLGDAGGDLRIERLPAVIVLCGLQGSGKTTTAGKLALRLRASGRRPLLVAADLQRAAAVEQLRQVGAAAEVPVFVPEEGEELPALAARLLRTAPRAGHDVLVVDTAGRLHVDPGLMQELQSLVNVLEPAETLFVADAMTGQDAVKSAAAFAKALPLTGVILTKLDGDARGGAALSIRSVAEVPIRLVGVGERPEDLELFDGERLASRILGMGDVLSLIEKAEKVLDAGETERLAKRISKREFTLEDLYDQLQQVQKMGPISQLMEMLPKGGPFRGLDASGVDDGRMVRIQAMIGSMTGQERRKPKILNASRKRRIVRGSGTTVQELNQLLKQYKGMKKMMKRMKGNWLQQVMGG